MRKIKIDKREHIKFGGDFLHLAARISTGIKSPNDRSNTRSSNDRWGFLEFFESLYDSDMRHATSRTSSEYECKISVIHAGILCIFLRFPIIFLIFVFSRFLW